MMFMLASKFSKALHFDEYNITKFFEHFEKNVINMKSSKRNEKLSSFATVLSSLQNS